eukprot:CAMPEP_0168618032 /NCGR_PEP_ID=MMETSP0449_2-20121227/5857_1 /TAXON_ID=1082188 /ORGANISM="Strombidium rassoulzadegani, Strain ras09" /LENGTH=417 /DNA_ID=CAMNT_0008658883 /DNA_START=3 /DNA_END=1253 /DNA_ORIENTATION=-
MPEITQDMLRKKSEHNESMLSTLEEISLHQLDIERITNLELYCRHLKILYLQNNLLEKMEGISKLKELEYINLAVNSISLIEGVRGCESLQKIDLTLNFVDIEDLEESVDNLAELPDLRELYIIGNPCTDWEHYKEYIYARLPNLGRLDAEDITKSMKLQAKQNLKVYETDLVIRARKNIEKKVLEEQDGSRHPNAYTKEFRRECYEEQKQRDEEHKKQQEENSMFKDYNDFQKKLTEKRDLPVYNEKGEVRQSNQGKYEWRFDETQDKTCIIFEIKVPKYMETAQINVDLHPDYLRLDVKGRITQLSIPENILVEKSKIQRSTTTGVLQLTMPKANLSEIEAQGLRIKRRMEQREQERKLRKLEKVQQEARDKAELAKIVQEEEAKTQAQAKKIDYENSNFIIRESELDAEKDKRL